MRGSPARGAHDRTFICGDISRPYTTRCSAVGVERTTCASLMSPSSQSRQVASDIPSHEEVRRAWNAVDTELRKGLKNVVVRLVQRHSAYRKKTSPKMLRAIASPSC